MTELASILQVPVLTTGTFQGSRGPQVTMTEAQLDKVVEGSNRLRPYLDQALTSGELAGNPELLKRIGKPLPAAINFNHDSINDDKIRESLAGVKTNFSKAMIEGDNGELKPWIVQNFEDVPPVTADFIRRYFQRRSVELLPLSDPETGTQYEDGVIISTAFLDNATPPAVPGQGRDLIVEFSASESTLCTVTTTQPIITPQEDIMPDKKEEAKEPVELTALQGEMAELRAKMAEQEAANLAEAKEKEALASELAAVKKQQEAGETEKYLSMLSAPHPYGGKVYAVSPAFQKVVAPLIKQNGVIELAEGQSVKAGMYDVINSVVEMAMAGNIAVCLSTSDVSPINPDVKPKTASEYVAELMEKNPKLSKSDAAIIANNEMYGGAE